METVFDEHTKLLAKGTLAKSLEDTQKTIDLLVKARNTIQASE